MKSEPLKGLIEPVGWRGFNEQAVRTKKVQTTRDVELTSMLTM